MQYCSVNTRTNNDTKASLHCVKNLVKIGSVTLEFKKGDGGMFAATGPQFDDSRPFGSLAF